MDNYIFIDTFAFDQLTNEYFDSVSKYLKLKSYSIVLTSMELVELYNPNPKGDDRINKISNLLTSVHFVICDQVKVMEAEEAAYPKSIDRLPIEFSSIGIIDKLSHTDKKELIYKLFSIGLPEFGVNLKVWFENFCSVKALWIESVHNIIEWATESGIINLKDNFLQSLDLRLCENLLKIKDSLEKGIDINELDKNYLNKLVQILDCHDTWRMKGIHFSSLIFWYEYVLAQKTILPSDQPDIYYSFVFPYCNAVIVDNSRYDCATKIQKKEKVYSETKFYNKREFIKELTN